MQAMIPEVKEGYACIEELIRYGYLQDPKAKP
ncbi:hypothetical protein BN948_03174 [Hydrogenophaga intermedia]|jgi:hypothetical protein|uniref:Uncharacterized protein n=1 Tax=Hydrogenophaga intermedia TaxID=65786 RepID=A0A1L1PFI3_HYDIT|nr:hypothetical protein BN948_03174 [Hydrogenophaga intermedia]